MTAPQPAPGFPGAARVPEHALRAGLVAGAAYTLVGWRALLVPSLILFVAPAFGQADAGMGAYYLATALAYGVGALFGGRFIRRFGARVILPSAAALMAVGLLVQGFTGAWAVFALAGVLTSIGASSTDVGIQALVLDLFPHARGRALNLLHVAYGVGALMAPLLLAALVGARRALAVADDRERHRHGHRRRGPRAHGAARSGPARPDCRRRGRGDR